MKLSPPKVRRAIDRLAQIRATLDGLRAAARDACETIECNGGGVSKRYVAQVEEVAEAWREACKVSAHVRIKLARRPR